MQTIEQIVEELGNLVGHKHSLGCAYFVEFRAADCNCSEKNIFKDKLRTTLLRFKEEVEGERDAAIVKELRRYQKHHKIYADTDNALARENKSGWNAAINYVIVLLSK